MGYAVVKDNIIQYMAKTEKSNSVEIENKYVINNNIIDCLQYKAIEILKDKANDMYKKYTQKYPEVEVKSFNYKAQEATLYMKNKQAGVTTNLEATPYLSALTNNDITARNALAEAVYAKIQEYAGIERYGMSMRDKIKSLTTIQDLQELIESL